MHYSNLKCRKFILLPLFRELLVCCFVVPYTRTCTCTHRVVSLQILAMAKLFLVHWTMPGYSLMLWLCFLGEYWSLCYIYTYKIHSLNCNFLWTLSFKVVFNNFEFRIVIISMSQVMIVKLHHLNRKYVVQLLGTVMVRLRYGTDKFSQIGELVCFYYICVIVL